MKEENEFPRRENGIFKYLKQCHRAAFSNQSNQKIRDYTSIDDNEFFY